ncbi:MAG: adenine deaminase [Sulfolobales archaeon]
MAREETLYRKIDIISWMRERKYSTSLLRELILASRGLIKSELILRNINLVNTASEEILENVSVIVYKGFIVRIVGKRDIERFVGSDTRVIDGEGSYALPGFIDAHVHIESSFLSPIEFSRLALSHGTTLVVADPHEVVNVGGVKALELYFELSSKTPLKILIQVPSCIPPVEPTLGIDSPGAYLSERDLETLIRDKRYHSLGEYMDYVSVINASNKALSSIISTHRVGKLIYGHIPSSDEEILDPYILTGISSCHESTRYEEALEKLRRGLYVMIREGSSWRDLDLAVELYKKRIDLSRVLLVSDDISVIDLYEKGYMDYIVREAIERGIDPIKAIKMTTLNPATYLRIDDLFGLISPGRVADIVLIRDLRKIDIDTVIADGEIVYRRGLLDERVIADDFREICNNTCRKITDSVSKLSPEDLIIRTSTREGLARVNVIEVVVGKTITLRREYILDVKEGYVRSDPYRDIIHIAVIDRYSENSSIGKAFVKGLGVRRGSIAQTIAHDTHNIIVAGANVFDMNLAVRELVRIGGGIVVVSDGEILSRVPLEGYGLFSTKDFIEVYRELKDLEKILRSLGASEERIYMTLSLLSLPVIPEIRLTPRGLVDVNELKIIEPVIEVF